MHRSRAQRGFILFFFKEGSLKDENRMTNHYWLKKKKAREWGLGREVQGKKGGRVEVRASLRNFPSLYKITLGNPPGCRYRKAVRRVKHNSEI